MINTLSVKTLKKAQINNAKLTRIRKPAHKATFALQRLSNSFILYINVFFMFCKIFFILWFCVHHHIALGSPIIEGENKITQQTTFTACMNYLSQGCVSNPYKAKRTGFFDRNGDETFLYNFKGSVVVVIFWANWCLPCIESIKTINKLMQFLEYEDINNVIILPIAIGENNVEHLKEALSQYNKELSIYFDQNSNLLQKLGAHSLPAIFILNKQNKIVSHFSDMIDFNHDNIKNFIAHLAKE